MALIADYAITPDVFDVTSYSGEEVCGLRLGIIKDAMLDEGLVRDLRGGEWQELLVSSARPWHRRAQEIAKKLVMQGRLVPCEPALATSPADDQGWCAEALASHAGAPMTGGVIATASVKAAYPEEPVVERVDTLEKAPWWRSRGSSVRLERSLDAYRRHLKLVLSHARSLQFVDAYLDPERDHYRGFADLLAGAGSRQVPPRIEIHRKCPDDHDRMSQNLDYIEGVFRRELAQRLRATGLSVEVYVWDDFHDRYLISNLIGIGMQNGFDTSGKADDLTTWTRLTRTDQDDIQREFDPASRRHKLRRHFQVP